jgi:hypothetical protein
LQAIQTLQQDQLRVLEVLGKLIHGMEALDQRLRKLEDDHARAIGRRNGSAVAATLSCPRISNAGRSLRDRLVDRARHSRHRDRTRHFGTRIGLITIRE